MITKDYYIHIVAEVLDTHDTVNILTGSYLWIEENDRDETFYFYGKENITTKLIYSNIEDISSFEDIENLKLKEINKVTRDPRYDFIANNNFPAIIGRVARK